MPAVLKAPGIKAAVLKTEERTLDHFSARGEELVQQTNVGHKSGLSLTMKWTKSEIRSRFALHLNPKAWTSIAESRLFRGKAKSNTQEEESRVSWDTPVEPGQMGNTHRRAKSEIVCRTVIETKEEPPELLELPRIPSPARKVLIQEVARKTVKDVLQEPAVLKSYADSIQLGVCYDHDDSTLDEDTAIGSQGSAEEKSPYMRDDSRNDHQPKDETICSSDHTKASLGERGVEADMAQNLANEEIISSESSDSDGEEQFRDCYFPFTLASRRDQFSDFDYIPPNSLVDNAVRNGVWGLNSSELIVQEHEREPTGLPKCTASRHTKNWKVTNSILAAYTAMQGPYRLAGRDMFVWMDRCGKTFPKPEDCSKHIGSCNSIIADLEPLSYDPPPRGEEPNRKQVFSIPRPPYKHIVPPPGFIPEHHQESFVEVPRDFGGETTDRVGTQSNDGYTDDLALDLDQDEAYDAMEEFVISDDEGDHIDGRISPYPYGAPDAYHQRLEELLISKQEEFEIDKSGYADSATSSLDYILIGYTEHVPVHLTEWHRELLGRMNCNDTPLDKGRQDLIEDATTGDTGSHPSYGSKPYTDSEILAALQAKDARTVNGISSQKAAVMIRRRHKTLEASIEIEQMALKNIVEAEKQITLREAQLERVSATVNTIIEIKANKQHRRRRDIYRHVSQHLRGLQEKAEVKYNETWELALQLASLLTKVKDLEAKMKEEAQKVGIYGAIAADDIEGALGRVLKDHGGIVDDADADDSFF
ncbi:hypothetical protein B0J13DRAFT_654877 [Dactylonectria estremocensis]|uniref:Uncharacterized protein n=1 Tax=Dactylonectria estremocensis TaxID=1079267 RepID=A0A9P9J932_9HYPO|nr:hypothetical protein B0J13DRAFT_654877 [Dactylonectria estremocensis]